MKIRYFAWLRARLGIEEETVDPPAEVQTVGQLVTWLRGRSDLFAEVLGDDRVVKVAVNKEFARPDDPVGAGDEVALFPPVTGG
ncbi:MAG: molybdopterin converting factor subunit 1 [Pseudomonadota bacterium]